MQFILIFFPNRFHNCLKRADTPVAKGVGDVYFNRLKIKCFVTRKKKQCLESSFFRDMSTDGEDGHSSYEGRSSLSGGEELHTGRESFAKAKAERAIGTELILSKYRLLFLF